MHAFNSKKAHPRAREKKILVFVFGGSVCIFISVLRHIAAPFWKEQNVSDAEKNNSSE